MKTRIHSRGVRAAALGMTLIEALITIGIMAIILFVVDQVFIVNEDVMVKQLARIDNDNGAVSAIKRLGELTRGATSVMASQVINGTTYTSSATTLVLKVPSIDSSKNIIAGTYDYIAIYRSGTDATRIFSDTAPGAGSVRVSGQKLVTRYNSVLTFSYNNVSIASATRVSVFLINTQTVRGSTLTTKAWTSIFLRNY